MRGDTDGRRVGAMSGAEGVVDVDIGQRCELCREFRIVRFLLGVKAEILEEQNVALLEGGRRSLDLWSDTVCRGLDGPPEEACQAFGDRGQPVLQSRAPDTGEL